MLTADLLAACKNNDTKRAQDLLANGILPDYSEPESGERGQLLRAEMRKHPQKALGTLNEISEKMAEYFKYLRNSQARTHSTLAETPKSSGSYRRGLLEDSKARNSRRDLGYSLSILFGRLSPRERLIQSQSCMLDTVTLKELRLEHCSKDDPACNHHLQTITTSIVITALCRTKRVASYIYIYKSWNHNTNKHVQYSNLPQGWTCLNWSVHNGNPVLTRALIRAGAAAGYKRASAAAAQVTLR